MERLLDEQISGQVREFFADLGHPVVVLFFTSADENSAVFCEQTQHLLEEIVELNDLLSLKVYNLEQDIELAHQYKITAVPSFVIAGSEPDGIVDYGIRYLGVPAGHELTSLVNSIRIVSMRDSNLSTETRAVLQSIKTPVQLQVFVTPTCPYCPRAVVLAHQLAFESPMIDAEMIEATEFPELADLYNVSGVPQTTINMGAGTVVGAANERQMVERIQEALI
jgi:glutaredoxin-like protein